ncbi:MAG: ATP-NAD kinase family protein [Tissierellia bacterium]|nr:ATP-NAD kinase family protein [Tissierellia bacterium]
MKLGLIINPIAGMGGSVGLKGTDGEEILNKAISLGAKPKSDGRAREALKELEELKDKLEIVTYPNKMGETVAKELGFNTKVIGKITDHTGPEDTKKAACLLRDEAVDLVLFVGGDGTARNIAEAIELKIPTLGIPSGVKMHSAVFSQTPKKAGELAKLFLTGEISSLKDQEVMDIDEDAFRSGELKARLYGYLHVPFEEKLLQGSKSTLPQTGGNFLDLAEFVVENMDDEYVYIIGSGTTLKYIMDEMGLNNTLLGIDIVHKKELIKNDATERDILEAINGKKAKIIITIIGGQGYIFGRGNQQLSPEVLRRVGKENIMIVAGRDKLEGLNGRPMLIDTGNPDLDKVFGGYYKVITGYGNFMVYPAEG